jgi:hypothetical protein
MFSRENRSAILLTLAVVGSIGLVLGKILHVEGIPQISKYVLRPRREFANNTRIRLETTRLPMNGHASPVSD